MPRTDISEAADSRHGLPLLQFFLVKVVSIRRVFLVMQHTHLQEGIGCSGSSQAAFPLSYIGLGDLSEEQGMRFKSVGDALQLFCYASGLTHF